MLVQQETFIYVLLSFLYYNECSASEVYINKLCNSGPLNSKSHYFPLAANPWEASWC